MKRFIDFIKESGDSEHHFKKIPIEKPKWSDESHAYSFHDDKGEKKHVEIHHQSVNDDHVATVAFHDKDKEANDDVKHKATGNLGHSAIKVFSTVKAIMKHHAEHHPEINKYEFSSDNSEPSRVRLYSKND